jgi:hypothetical protein
MISPSDRVTVFFFGLSFFTFFFYLISQRPVIFVSFFFIIFSLAWRMSATMYIDLAGPVYSSQLVRSVGPGTATISHSIAYVVSLIPFLYFFRRDAVERWRDETQRKRTPPGFVTLADATFVLSLVFLFFLFFDLVHRGSIPLFAHIERFVYTAQYAGTSHRFLIQYGNLITFWWGMMFAATYIRDHHFDRRILVLVGAIAIYAFLTGNRFSAFYSQISFFVTPWAAVIALRHRNPEQPSFSWIKRSFASRMSRLAAAGVVLALVGVISFAVYNNLANVRGYAGEEIWRQAFDRVLIQPSEVGWVSFERVFKSGQSLSSVVFDALFQRPLDPNRNTSIQYLMFATIGEPETTDAILHGSQLAGGFPEIFFELCGPYLAWPFLLGAGCIAAALTAYIIRGMLRGDYASAFLSLYVLYGFYVMYIGGMLNFATARTYSIKIAALAAAVLMERSLARRGLSLIPWTLFRRPQPAWLERLSRRGRQNE